MTSSLKGDPIARGRVLDAPVREGMDALARIPVLSHGFRLFFLSGAIWAALAMTLWIGTVSGTWAIARSLGPVEWHAHEFLFGYVVAIITGFLLTAVPNWTRRLPVRGGPLLLLFLLWTAGRAALLVSDWIGVLPAAIIDGLFLPVLGVVILREIVAGQNWRNLKTAALVSALAIANIAFHAELIVVGRPDYSLRAGVAVILCLVMLIGGRIVPSFTRNWLVHAGAKRLPIPFGHFDTVAVLVAVSALAAWVATPDNPATAGALLLAGLLQILRLSRWAGFATWGEPLVFILHLAYAFVPLGFLLVGAAILWPMAIPAAGALHVWTVGSMTLMTLGVMTRATRGHTGRALIADAATRFIYAALVVAVGTRLFASLIPGLSETLLALSAASWIGGFGAFILSYGPMLVNRRYT